MSVQDDSKLLSGFLYIDRGNRDNNLESSYINLLVGCYFVIRKLQGQPPGNISQFHDDILRHLYYLTKLLIE
jgi:hypothetical protein